MPVLMSDLRTPMWQHSDRGMLCVLLSVGRCGDAAGTLGEFVIHSRPPQQRKYTMFFCLIYFLTYYLFTEAHFVRLLISYPGHGEIGFGALMLG